MGVLRNDQPHTQATLDEATRLIGDHAPPRKLAVLRAKQLGLASRGLSAGLAGDRAPRRDLPRGGHRDRCANGDQQPLRRAHRQRGYAEAVALAEDSAQRLRSLKSTAVAWALIYIVLGRTMLGDDKGLLPVAHEAFSAGLLISTTYQGCRDLLRSARRPAPRRAGWRPRAVDAQRAEVPPRRHRPAPADFAARHGGGGAPARRRTAAPSTRDGPCH